MLWRPAPAANDPERSLQLSYDAEQRLVRVVEPVPGGQRVSHYHYDAFGRRVAKRVASPGQAERTTLFVWDGDMLLQQVDAQRTVTYVSEPQSFVPPARTVVRPPPPCPPP